jgi:hypothetical protein
LPILRTGLAAAHPWKEQRAFTLSLLRGFGFGKRSMESTISDEAKSFVSVVAKERGSPVCINGLINKAKLNVNALCSFHGCAAANPVRRIKIYI